MAKRTPPLQFYQCDFSLLTPGADGEPQWIMDRLCLAMGQSGVNYFLYPNAKNNLTATTAPGVGDDSADGYDFGSLWVNNSTNTAYICVDPAAGAAVWQQFGSGSVTSVSLAMPSQFAITGSPVTGSGTLTAAWNTQTANYIFAGPVSGGAAAPTFRAMVVADLPSEVMLDADHAADPHTMTIDGRDVSVDGAKLDGVEAGADVTDATNVAAAGAVMDSDFSPGEGFMRKTGAGTYTAHKSNLAAAVPPAVTDDTNAGYSIGSTWLDTTADKGYLCLDASVGAAVWKETTSTGTGTVTSVGLSMPTQFSVAGTPVTTAGTLAVTWGTQTANTLLAGPASGAPAVPTFRTQVVADLPAFTGLTATDIAVEDEVPIYDATAAGNRKVTVERLLGRSALVCAGRLTTSSTLPVTIADQLSPSTLYLLPYAGNFVRLYDGTRWKLYFFTSVSKALSGLTSGKNYDVFLYDNAGTLDFEFVVWTDNTTRATGLTTQDGILVKSGDATRLYLGTFRANGTSQTIDSVQYRWVWNYYNRVQRVLRKLEATDTWAYTTGAWRQMNNSNGNQVELVTGWEEDPIYLDASATISVSSGTAYGYVGIGEDSTTAPEANCLSRQLYGTASTTNTSTSAVLTKVPTVGYHYYAALEYGAANFTFYGDAGIPDRILNGLRGWVMG